jgi:hypothetical protein
MQNAAGGKRADFERAILRRRRSGNCGEQGKSMTSRAVQVFI